MSNNISVCGIDCDVACLECNTMHEELKASPCKGCNSIKGKIFWTKFIELDTCPIYKCVEDKKNKNCGDCNKFPCNIYSEMKDPNISKEQHQQSIKDRVKLLQNL